MKYDWLDVPQLISELHECLKTRDDRDPLDLWQDGPVLLLGTLHNPGVSHWIQRGSSHRRCTSQVLPLKYGVNHLGGIR